MACIITDEAASMHCSVLREKRKNKEDPKMAEMSFSIKSIDIKQIYLNRKGSMVLGQNKLYDMFSQKFGYVRLSFLCYIHNVYVENLNSVPFQLER